MKRFMGLVCILLFGYWNELPKIVVRTEGAMDGVTWHKSTSSSGQQSKNSHNLTMSIKIHFLDPVIVKVVTI